MSDKIRALLQDIARGGWEDAEGGTIDVTEARRWLQMEFALDKINDIRNEIVGLQQINWSAHIYPLVAALEEAGIKGEGYEEAKKKAVTLLEQRDRAEAERDEALGAFGSQMLEAARSKISELMGERDKLESRLNDAHAMGERLRALIEAMRAANKATGSPAHSAPHHAGVIDEMAQIATVLLAVKS